jgi:hypothetical protein
LFPHYLFPLSAASLTVSAIPIVLVVTATASVSISVYRYHRHPNHQSHLENSRNPRRYT